MQGYLHYKTTKSDWRLVMVMMQTAGVHPVLCPARLLDCSWGVPRSTKVGQSQVRNTGLRPSRRVAVDQYRLTLESFIGWGVERDCRLIVGLSWREPLIYLDITCHIEPCLGLQILQDCWKISGSLTTK